MNRSGLTHIPGAGPAVLLVHGASGTAQTWELVAAAWSWADVWVVDLPGRGASSQPLDSVEALAEWLGEVVRDLPTQDVAVVGHSLGGAIGLQVALDHPERLSALVMASSASRLRVAPAILELVAQTDEAHPLDLSFAFAPDTPPTLIDGYQQRARGVPAASASADWRACDGFDVRARLASVSVPVLVAYGTADRLTVPRFQTAMAQALPNATAQAFEGVGHMLPWEAPRALAAAVQAFLASLE